VVLSSSIDFNYKFKSVASSCKRWSSDTSASSSIRKWVS